MAESYQQLLNKVAFAQTVAGLSTYYGLTTPQDTTEIFALRSVQGFTNLLPNQQIRPSQAVSRIVDDVINTTGGAFTTAQTARRIFRFLEGSNNVTANNGISEGTRATISRTIKIFCATNTADQGNNTGQIDPNDFYQPLIGPVIGQESGQGIINRNPKNPTKLEPTLSAFQINSVLALPTSKNTNGICLYLNGVPSLELARSVPYLDIKFLFGRDPYRISDGRLQTNSLLRAIEGAISVNGNRVLQTLAEANTVSGSAEGSRSQLGVTSVAGMEMFLQPQLLVNGNEFFNPQTRAVPVLDPFRPLLTFKDFSVEVAQAAGMASYKTAKLGFVLHDRSRMTEVAEFLKPDLYGATELLIEYGWSHPDAAYGNGTNVIMENPYGVLINGMRVKEKYGIRNIQAAFDDSGQVGITLDLFMKGADELRSVQIASAETGTTEIIREIENLSSLIHAYERRLTPTNSTQVRSPEIRGSQILQNASDYQSHIQLSQEILSNLREFRQSLQRTRNVDRQRVVTPLLNALDNLYRNRTSPSRTSDSSGGAVARLSTTTQRSIEEKMRRIATPNNDPFLPTNLERGTRESRLGRLRRTNGSTNTNTAVRQANIDLTNMASHVSLGKLLLNFVGIPLCLTNKFDDVQFLFYPFNAYAGKANSLNISQFIVDTAFFIRQYTRLRTESVSRSANLSLAEFLSFLTSTILDDNGAESYGIWSAFERVFDASTGIESVQGRGNQVEFQQRMENILRNQTPDGTFKMPQIDFFLETLPGKNTEEAGDGVLGTNLERSILRIHVYDKQCTQYEAQSSILGSSRDSILCSIGSVPQTATSLGNNDVLETHRANFVAVRQLAGNLVEEVGQGTGQYRVTGGAQRIKEFVMATMPYIVYGMNGTAIRGNASLQSQQDSALSTINMLRSLRNDPLEPNGEQPGGIPLSIIPAQLSFNTYGCPLIDFAQQFFIDFQTGTSWDNIYGVVGLSHKLTPGDFVTEIKFAPLDAYGKYRSMIEQINFFSQRLRAAT